MTMLELAQIIFCRRGGVQFKPWYRRESSDCFIISPEFYTNIDSWCHEFNEEAMWYTLRDGVKLSNDYLNSEAIVLSLPDGEKEAFTPTHVIISIQDVSYFKGSFINPEMYIKMLKWRNETD